MIRIEIPAKVKREAAGSEQAFQAPPPGLAGLDYVM